MGWRELVEALFKIPTISLVGLGGGGRYIYHISNESGSNQLWVLDMARGSRKQVSHGGERVTDADSELWVDHAVFTRDFGGSEKHQIYVADADRGERRISDLPSVRITSIKMSQDGSRIAFTMSDQVSVRLAVMDLGGKYDVLYTHNRGIFCSDWKDSLIACTTRTTSDPWASELLLVNVADSEARVYTPREGSANSRPVLSGDGSKVLFYTDARGRADLAVLDITGELRYTRASEVAPDFAGYGWIPGDKAIWYIGKVNGSTRLYIEDLESGVIREVPGPQGHLGSLHIDPSSSGGYALHSSMKTPPGIVHIDLEGGGWRDIYRPEVPGELAASLGDASFTRYRSSDGLEIPAFIIKSKAAPVPGPTVIWVHGGPWAEVADEWSPSIQALAVAGFHVVAPNFRGSTGYGPSYAKMNIGDPGGGDLADVVSAREHAIEIGLADPERVFIHGASYGGFMTFLATVKYPDLWRAGAAVVGVTDWVEMYELSDAVFKNFIERLFAGKPSEKLELYRDRSAMSYAERLKAPLMIWHRLNDSRTPLKPVLRYAMRLLELGKQFELHVIPHEGHGPQRVENITRQIVGVIEFLKRHL